MNIYKIELRRVDYDEYDSFVVSAKDESKAKELCGIRPDKDTSAIVWDNLFEANIEKVTLIGTYYKEVEESILGSFNAG